MSKSDIGRILEPKLPREVPCDWCGDKSVKAVRIEKKATSMYACGKHVKVAEETAKKPPRRINI